ncbi:hypothetical protein D3C81_2251250 [compost metagenome]
MRPKQLNEPADGGKRIPNFMGNRRRNLAQHRQLIVLIGRLFDPLEIGNVLDAQQKVSIHLIAVRDRDEPMPAVFVD